VPRLTSVCPIFNHCSKCIMLHKLDHMWVFDVLSAILQPETRLPGEQAPSLSYYMQVNCGGGGPEDGFPQVLEGPPPPGPGGEPSRLRVPGSGHRGGLPWRHPGRYGCSRTLPVQWTITVSLVPPPPHPPPHPTRTGFPSTTLGNILILVFLSRGEIAATIESMLHLQLRIRWVSLHPS